MGIGQTGLADRAMAHLPTFRAIGFVEFVCHAGRLAMPDFACDLIWLEDRLAVVGPMTRGLVIDVDDRRAALAALNPLEARHLLGCPLGEIADQVIPVRDVAPALASPLEDLFASGHGARLARSAATTRSRPAPEGDHRLIASAMRGLARGHTSESVAQAHNLSDRHLRRLFQDGVGMTPGAYARIRRFRAAVSAALKGEGLAASSHAAGYADQSHFNREARRLTGLTPREVLAGLGGGEEAVALARED